MYDVLTFGKYRGCRIDSMLQHDYEYLQYLKYNKIVIFDSAVLDALENMHTLNNAEVVKESPVYKDSFDQINGYTDNWEEDVPF